MARRSYLRDLAASPEEIEAAKRAQSAGGTGAAIGTTLGTALGGVGGGLLGTFALPGLGTAAGAGLGATLGGGIGSAIGGMAGGAVADDAEEKLSEGQKKRQELLEQEGLYEEALQRVLRT